MRYMDPAGTGWLEWPIERDFAVENVRQYWDLQFLFQYDTVRNAGTVPLFLDMVEKNAGTF
jgi:hypothetical protein